MDGYEVKKVMDQVHISSQMQEEVIWNIQKRMEQENKNTGVWSFWRMAAAAAAFVLAAGIVSFPVRAFVASVVQERMESVPEEEMKGLNDMVQSQRDVLADGFSRAYSDSEKERSKILWQAYENGTFPEKVIAQAAADKAREKTARLEKAVQDANGISREEAVEIAKQQLLTDLGDKAGELELMTYNDGTPGVSLLDASDYSEAEFASESKAGVIYDVGFGNPDTHAAYGYMIDAVDGSILYTYKSN